MAQFALRNLAVPSVCILICFLAYSSQFLFYHLDPGPLTTKEAIWFNILVAAVWWSYERAIRVDPGRLPKNLARAGEELEGDILTTDVHKDSEVASDVNSNRGRWCMACNAPKPPRSHHCSQCARCVPKMDHHCPWTSNCVSHTTFPHFIRFTFYVVLAVSQLGYFLFVRLSALWSTRNQPSYLGPSIWALTHLLLLSITNTLIFFALTILLVTAANSLIINTMMIEHWEIERHEALVARARHLGGYVYGPGGRRVRIKKQEFPYDIGIWNNLVQGMGTRNVLMWFLPFGGGPSNESGWSFETNGFEDEGTTWPPVDPDKLPRPTPRNEGDSVAFVHSGDDTTENDVQAFRRRQEEDYKRWQGARTGNTRAGALRSSEDTYDDGMKYEEDEEYESEYEEGIDGEEGWTSRDGSRLRDFGVDEDAEEAFLVDNRYYEEEEDDDDDIPLGELIRRRKRAQGQA